MPPKRSKWDRVPRICENCGKHFFSTRSNVRRGNGRFCGHRCTAISLFGGPIEERFWAAVKKASPDECWEWQKSTVPAGYGQIQHNGKNRTAHRVSWELHHGEIPEGMHVLHRCDNRACVNPSHLFLGTHLDNVRDMVKKGRNNRKLTPAQVREIRSITGKPHVEIAKQFGVSRSLIGQIRQGTAWKHVK